MSGKILTSLLTAVIFFTGCKAVHEANRDPQPKAVASGEFRQASRTGASKSEIWWRTFRDPTLNRLEDAALDENFNARAVAHRIDQANAELQQAGARLFPQLDAAGDLGSSWAATQTTSSSIGSLLTWELDVWGGLRSVRSARERDLVAATEDWLAVRLLLTAAVAETYFQILEQRQQLVLIREQVEVNQDLLDSINLRYGQGQGSLVDVLQQQNQLEATEALRPDVEGRLEQLELALDVLLGQTPGARARISRGQLNRPPALPRTGVPSDLLLERPDLRAERARIVALDHEIGEAIADRLPQFSLTGALFASGTPAVDTLAGDLGTSMLGPIFDAGSRKAEVQKRRSRVKEAVDAFSNSYLSAIRDVETALVRERKQRERLTLLEQQLATARRLLTESQNRYTNGVTDYLPVLDAVQTVQGLERELITSRRELLSFRVALHRALGGPMPAPPVS